MAAKTYYVTEKAGRYVAGKKLGTDQKTIKLTEPEARYELDLGTLSETDPAAVQAETENGLKPVAETVSESSSKTSKKSA
ncbi:hypothetical protein [Microvirga sp. Mcv34]|uniref:hypothetical protein n=1 Tax=Microvirga sp. Mcv34 TaxID=2926016 RepID=UPI0021C901A1|nr:hypothetical protein [Microvirga sp. Mcv34]